MLAGEIAKLMNMELLLPDMADKEMEISGCYIGDLLSNVMGKAKTGQIWLTVMTNINILPAVVTCYIISTEATSGRI